MFKRLLTKMLPYYKILWDSDLRIKFPRKLVFLEQFVLYICLFKDNFVENESIIR
ncbi:MAG: hypothetical protein CM15mP58_21840 [Burkholderiaceae bacterium]|nr:MAG: hypothetical protein CM15mP58_21840 [Burkholderiaceae bacterium]